MMKCAINRFFSSNFTRRSKDWDNNNAHWIWWTIYFLKEFISETIWIFDEVFCFFPLKCQDSINNLRFGGVFWMKDKCVYLILGLS